MFLLGSRVNISRHSAVNFLHVPRAARPVIIAEIKVKARGNYESKEQTRGTDNCSG